MKTTDNKNIGTWKITDPSTGQRGRQLSEFVFEFQQENLDPQQIDLKEYPVKEQEYIINAYGYTLMSGENKNPKLQNIIDLYSDSANWIIAECIYESEL